MNAGTNRKSLRAEFERVVDLELSSLVRTAELVLKDPRPAEELVVEAVGEAYRRRGQVPAPVSSLRPELYRAMIDVMFSRFLPWTAQFATRAVDISDQFESPESLEFPLPDHIGRAEMDELVRELPHPLRMIVTLSVVGHFSYDEISVITGLHIEAIRSRMRRGRSQLSRLFFRNFAEEVAVQSSRN